MQNQKSTFLIQILTAAVSKAYLMNDVQNYTSLIYFTLKTRLLYRKLEKMNDYAIINRRTFLISRFLLNNFLILDGHANNVDYTMSLLDFMDDVDDIELLSHCFLLPEKRGLKIHLTMIQAKILMLIPNHYLATQGNNIKYSRTKTIF